MTGLMNSLARLPKRITVEIDPGPTNRGIPMGTMRSRNRARASWKEESSTSSCLNRSTNRAVPWIMESPVLKRRIPPAIWNAGMEMPKNVRMASPTSRQRERAMTTNMLITAAMDRRTPGRVDSLMARKIGMMLNGLRTAKIAANAVSPNCRWIGFICLLLGEEVSRLLSLLILNGFDEYGLAIEAVGRGVDLLVEMNLEWPIVYEK